LTPGSGSEIKSPDPGSGSGMNIPDQIPDFFGLKILIYVIQNLFDPGSGTEKFGSRINIPDPHHNETVALLFHINFSLRATSE
jgi:hypothetical protein